VLVEMKQVCLVLNLKECMAYMLILKVLKLKN